MGVGQFDFSRHAFKRAVERNISEQEICYEVEFMTLAGETVAVVTLLPAQVRPIARRDVAHVRELAAPNS